MSRTKKGSKAPGWEIWSKRPMTGSAPGRWAKTMTHRIERRKDEEKLRHELKKDE